MSTATTPIPSVKGGKVWNLPSNGLPKLTIDTIIFAMAASFVVSALLVSITAGILGLIKTNIIDFDFLMPANPETISTDTGYPISIVISRFDMFPYAMTAIALAVILLTAVLFSDVWDKVSMALLILAIPVLVLGSSLSLQINEHKTAQPMTPIAWMSERYEFEPIANVAINGMFDGMLMRDANNKEVIAEVKENNGKYFLYNLDGIELPIRK